MNSTWVFAYGSLMWRPGFVFEEEHPARLHGAHRALCVYSHVHRGTPERPGLVLGLDRGGRCRGVAFRVALPLWEETLRYLREREQTTGVYRETRRQVALLDGSGRRVSALCYVVDRTHPQYAGKLDLTDQLRHVGPASGRSGPNPEYVVNTVQHLVAMGIRDNELLRLAERLESEGVPNPKSLGWA